MPDDDYRITERIDHALDVDARRNPLPSDFAASIAAHLEDRPSRRVSWFSSVPAIAATVALAILAITIPLSLSRLSMTPAPGGSEPTAGQRSLDVTPATTPSASTHSTPEASPRGLTEAEAVEAARSAADRPGMTAVRVESGPASDVLSREDFEWAHVPSDDTWVWLIILSDGGPPLGAEGSFVVLDYFDGTIYGVQDWIS